MIHFQWVNMWAVREGDWKLIGINPRKPGGQAKYTLHILADAEPEVKDYSQEKPELVEQLAALHEEWLTDVSASANQAE